MLKSVVFDTPYDEAAVRGLARAFEKFPSVKMQQISVSFATHPGVRFEFTGPDVENLIKQANATQIALKESA